VYFLGAVVAIGVEAFEDLQVRELL